MIDTATAARPLPAIDTPEGREALAKSQAYSNRNSLKQELARIATESVDALDDTKVRELLETLGVYARTLPAPVVEGPRGIAATIRQQIGTDAWLAVSARDFGYFLDTAGNVVARFRVGSRHGLPVIVSVTYHAGRDTYTVECCKIRRNGSTKAVLLDGSASSEDVYAESLGMIVRAFNAAAYL